MPEPAPPNTLVNAAGGGAVLVAALVLIACFGLITFDLRAAEVTLNTLNTAFHRAENSIADQQRSVTSTSAIGYILLGASGAAAWIAGRRRRATISPLLLMSLALFVGMCYASYIWSENRPLTIRKLAIFGFFMMAAIGYTRWLSIRGFALACMWTAVYGCVLGVLAEVRLGLFRPWRLDYRFSGLVNPNEQALYCALICLVAVFLLRSDAKHRTLAMLLLALGGGLLILTKSRTGLGACVVAAMTGVLIRARPSTKLLLVGLGFVAAGFVASVIAYNGSSTVVGVASLGRSEHVGTLTGRLPLWTLLLDEAADHPLLGAGYGAFWDADNIEVISETFFWHIPQGHSIYIDALLNLGLIGLLLYVGLFVLGLLKATAIYRETGDPQYVFAASMVLLALIHGATESKFLATGLPALVLFGGLANLAWGQRAGATEPEPIRPRPLYSPPRQPLLGAPE